MTVNIRLLVECQNMQFTFQSQESALNVAMVTSHVMFACEFQYIIIYTTHDEIKRGNEAGNICCAGYNEALGM